MPDDPLGILKPKQAASNNNQGAVVDGDPLGILKKKDGTTSAPVSEGGGSVSVISESQLPQANSAFDVSKYQTLESVRQSQPQIQNPANDILDRDIEMTYATSLRNPIISATGDRFSLSMLSNAPRQEAYETEKNSIKTSSSALADYRKKRLREIDDEIKSVDSQRKPISAGLTMPGISGGSSSLLMNEQSDALNQDISSRVQELSTYKKDLDKAIVNNASKSVAREALSEQADTGKPLDISEVGYRLMKVIGDPSVVDDDKAISQINAPEKTLLRDPETGLVIGTTEPSFDVNAVNKAKQFIDYRRYQYGADALTNYFNGLRNEIYEKSPQKIDQLNVLLDRLNSAKSLSEKQQISSEIQPLLADSEVSSYIDAERQLNSFLDKSKTAIDQFPQVKRRQMRQQLNDAYLALVSAEDAAGGTEVGRLARAVFGSTPGDDDIKYLSQSTGISEDQVKSIVDEGGFFQGVPYAVRIQGLLQGVAGGAGEMLTKARMGIRRLTDAPNAELSNRLSQDRLDELNLRAQGNKLRDDMGKYNFNPYSIFNTMGSGIGQTAALAIPSLLTGGLAAEGTVAAKLIDGATTLGSGFVSSYEDGYKEAAANTSDEATRKAYATWFGLVNAAPELIMSPADVIKKIGGGRIGGKELFENFVKEVGENGLEKTFASRIAAAGKNFANVLGAEQLEEQLTLAGETAGKSGILGVETTLADYMNQAQETAITTAITTLPLAIGAGIGGANDVSGIRKQALFEAGNEPDLYKARLTEQLDKGNISQDQYNNRVSVVNTMQNIVATIPNTDNTGRQLSYEEKANLAAQQFRIENNKHKEQQGLLEAEKPIVEADTAEATAIQASILTPQQEVAQAITDEGMLAQYETVFDRIDKGEGVNENELFSVATNLEQLAKENDSVANLVNPLIDKLLTYDNQTTTRTSQVTQDGAVTRFGVNDETREAVRKNLDQFNGQQAVLTKPDGTSSNGTLSLIDGNYNITTESGENIPLGEKAITDRDITIADNVDNPIGFDADGNVSSVSLQLNRIDTENGGTIPNGVITINFSDPEQGLDFAIRLRAEQVGTFTDPEFEEIIQEVSEEIPINNLNTTQNEGQEASNESEQSSASIPSADNQEAGQLPRSTGERNQEGNVTIQEGVSAPVSQDIPSLEINNPENTTTNATTTTEGARQEGTQQSSQQQRERVIRSQREQAKEQTAQPGTNDSNSVQRGEAEEEVAPESSITQAGTSQSREEFGLGNEYQKQVITDAELDQQANTAIKAGYNIEGLISRLENGSDPTALEVVILKKYLASLEAQVAKDASDENLAALLRLVQATDASGSRVGRAFRLRQGFEVRDDSLAGFFVREQETSGLTNLSEDQKKLVKSEYENIQDALAKYEEKILKLEAENARMRASQSVDRQKSSASKTKKSKEDYAAERKAAIDSAREKLKKLRGESQVTIIPYANELIAIAPEVAKVVKSLVEEGVTNLNDVVKRVYDEFKPDVPNLTEKDVHDIIAGDYSERRQTRTEVAVQLRDLRDQAKLIKKLEALEAGSVPANPRLAIKRSREIEDLKSKIKNHPGTRLNDYKNRTAQQISKLENDLATGNFQVAPPRPGIVLDKEATDLKDKLIKLRMDREIRLMRQEYEKRSKVEKGIDAVGNVLNVPRSIMSSLDFSAPLRQAAIVTVAHPRTAANAGLEMFKQAFSQKRFDRWFYDLQDSPRFGLMQESGLYVANPHDPRLTVREEQFMSNLAEKIPLVGKLVKGSERAYTSYLNKMRVDLFNRMADAYEADGFTFEKHPEMFKGLASFINNSTGRGNLGMLETAAPVLNAAFFSPRLIASRLNILGIGDLANPGNGYYAKMSPKVRKAALADLGKFVGAGIAVLSLIAFAVNNSGDDDDEGAEVEVDPRSSDFGKLRIGKTRWDVWGGFQQYIRIIAQLASGQAKSVNSGNINELSGEGLFGKTRADQLIGFVRGKLAPVPSFAADWLSGRTAVGEKFEWKEAVKNRLLPLTLKDAVEAVGESGVKSIFTQAIPSSFGIGVQTYLPRGYETEDLKNPTYRYLYDHNINLNPPPKGEMTTEQYDKYVPLRKSIMQREWEQVIQYGAYINDKGHVTINEDAAESIKPADKLTYDELAQGMKSISSKASREAKKELGLTPESE